MDQGIHTVGTWPLCKISMTDNGVNYSLFKHFFVKYEDIVAVNIRWGYVFLRLSEHGPWYGYTGKGLEEVVKILQDHGVAIDVTELRKLGFSVGFVRAQWIFFGVFLSLWLCGLLFGLGLIAVNYLAGSPK